MENNTTTKAPSVLKLVLQFMREENMSQDQAMQKAQQVVNKWVIDNGYAVASK